MPFGTEEGLGPGDIVLDGDPAPPKGGYSPQFLTHVYCGQTAAWIKMPPGTEVNLGSCDVVLDGVTAPPIRGTAHVYCGQTAGWMKTPLGTELDLGPGHIVLDGDPAPPRKGHSSPPVFSAHVYCGYGRPSQLLLTSCGYFTDESLTCQNLNCTNNQILKKNTITSVGLSAKPSPHRRHFVHALPTENRDVGSP